MECPEFIALYRSDPDRALDPEDEYRRHKASAVEAQKSSEERDARQAVYARINADKLKAADDRWKEVGPRQTQSRPTPVALFQVDGGRVTESGTTAGEVASSYGSEDGE